MFHCTVPSMDLCKIRSQEWQLAHTHQPLQDENNTPYVFILQQTPVQMFPEAMLTDKTRNTRLSICAAAFCYQCQPNHVLGAWLWLASVLALPKALHLKQKHVSAPAAACGLPV